MAEKKEIIYLDAKYESFSEYTKYFYVENRRLFLSNNTKNRKSHSPYIPTDFEELSIPAIEAMNFSIGKWITVASSIRKLEKCIDDGGGETCSLCRKYISCMYCPIQIYGFHHCNRTPFDSYRKAIKQHNIYTAYFYASQEVHFLLKVRDSVFINKEQK